MCVSVQAIASIVNFEPRALSKLSIPIRRPTGDSDDDPIVTDDDSEISVEEALFKTSTCPEARITTSTSTPLRIADVPMWP